MTTRLKRGVGWKEHDEDNAENVVEKGKKRRLNIFTEPVKDPTLFERAETLMQSKGIRPLSELLKSSRKGEITDVKFLRASEPTTNAPEGPRTPGVLDVVKFDYANERWSVYCAHDDALEDAWIDLIVEGNRFIGVSNVTIGRDPDTKRETVELGGEGTAIEIQDDAYMGKGLCQIMLIVNLYYYFALRLLSAGDTELPRVMEVHIDSHFPMSAFTCYEKAAKIFGYEYESGSASPDDAADYQERMLEHYDKLGLRDSFSEDYFEGFFEFVRSPSAPSTSFRK